MDALLAALKAAPESVQFEDVITVINEHYTFTPTAFTNGLGDNKVVNAIATNEGSCRIFAFAALHQLTKAQTLHCFGHHYRDDVLATPEGDSHGNIRAFLAAGPDAVQFDSFPLAKKA